MGLRIDLDQREVYPGQPLTGTITASGDLSRAVALNLRIYYLPTRHGEHTAASGPVATSFPAGETEVTHPFRILVPEDAPVSYRGREVSLDWYAEASLDVPWAIDPVSRATFEVVPRPEHAPVTPPPEPQPKGWLEESCGGIGGLFLMLLLCLFIPHLIILAVIVGPIILLLWGMHRLKFSEFTFGVAPTEKVMFGQRIHYCLTFHTRTSFEINEVTITLEGNEVYTTGSGKSRQTHHVQFLSQTHTPCKACTLPVGRFRTEGTFAIPPGLPSSLASTYEYKISANVDIPWWPDSGDSKTITVIPVICAEAAANLPPDDGTTSGSGGSGLDADDETGRVRPSDEEAADHYPDDRWEEGVRTTSPDELPAEPASMLCPACHQPIHDEAECPWCGITLRT